MITIGLYYLFQLLFVPPLEQVVCGTNSNWNKYVADQIVIGTNYLWNNIIYLNYPYILFHHKICSTLHNMSHKRIIMAGVITKINK